MKLSDQVGKLIDRAGKLARVQNKGRNAAQRDAAPHKQQRAEDGNQRQRKVADAVDRGSGHTGRGICLPCGEGGFLVKRGKTGAEGVFLVIGADGSKPGNRFLGKTVELAQRTGAAAEERADHSGTVAREENGKGNGEGEDEKEHRGNGQHHGKGADHGDETGDHLGDIRGKGRPHSIHIIGNDGDDISGLMRIEKGNREYCQMVIQILAHFPDNPPGNPDHDGRLRKRNGGRQERCEHHQEGKTIDKGKINGRARDRIDGQAGEPRGKKRERVAQNSKDAGEEKGPFAGTEIGEQPSENVTGFLLRAGGGIHAARIAHAASPPSCRRHRSLYALQDFRSSAWVPWPMTAPLSMTRMSSQAMTEDTR